MQRQQTARISATGAKIDRRGFLKTAANSALAVSAVPTTLTARAAPETKPPNIDTHMHVWGNDPPERRSARNFGKTERDTSRLLEDRQECPSYSVKYIGLDDRLL